MTTPKHWLDTLHAEVATGPGAGCTLLVAVSGGGDSTALLHGLARLREGLSLRLIVAHLDHALRPESSQDAAFVGQLALSLSLLCLRERREVAALAAQRQQNLEACARQSRYEMLESAALAVGARAIVLAHTLDDQAETMLMHLLRGAGLDGLKGMMPLAPNPLPTGRTPLFRPLLGVERATLRAWLREEGLAWREDASNAASTPLRNRLRHYIIPLLEAEQPRLRARLATTARLLADEYEWAEAGATAAWLRLAREEGDTVVLARAPFLALPAALQRRLLRRAFFLLRPERDLSYEQLSHALAVAARGPAGARATLPGNLFLTVGPDSLRVGPATEGQGAEALPAPLTLPEVGEVRAEGWTLRVRQVGRESVPTDWQALPAHVALLDAAALRWPLRLRRARAGERWAPLGMKGRTVSLRGWLASHGVPPHLRAGVPLLVDAEDQVLWVVGWQVGHVAPIRPSSQAIVEVLIEAPPVS